AMTAIPPITILGESIRWRAFVRSERALRIFRLGRFTMGSIVVADADPALACQLVVTAASFVFWGRPAVHLAEQIHELQGSLYGRGRVRPRLAALFPLSLLNHLPARHHAPNVFRVHEARLYR